MSKIVLKITLLMSFVLIMVMISGCMTSMKSMHGNHERMNMHDNSNTSSSKSTYEQQTENATIKLVDKLKKEHLPIKQIAVGEVSYSDKKIESLDAEAIVLSEIRNNLDWDLVDRNKIKVLLREQEMGVSGLVDESTAPTIGKVIGVNNFLFISLNLNEEIVSVSLKIIDVSSGKILWIAHQKGAE